MKFKYIIFPIIIVVVIGVIFTINQTQYNSKSTDLTMNRSIGTVNTSLGSPILGSSTPITIIEFGTTNVLIVKNGR